MALSMLASIPNLITHTRLPIIRRSSSCKASPPGNQSMIGNSTCEEIIVRRTANYHPPIWDYDYVQSLRSDYVVGMQGETYTRRLDKLKRDVKPMLGKVKKPLDQLELIDVLQRLGLYYHFKDEIKRILDSIYNQYNQHEEWMKDDLYATALEFRLLRQHGYDVPQDVFIRFKDETGSFKACLCEDMKGMLCLYEASYLCVQGESTMEQARDFAHRHLGKGLEQNIDQNLAIEVNHALELPLHWRMPRLEARWFIDVCEKRQDMNPILLEFDKLDFNMVQATHQEDLRYMSR
uniref:Terpene synthase N-terminal domain-containing protein n=1 Tax=Vitis vinifera TaxID=29760 RepID=F6I6K0_VITVI